MPVVNFLVKGKQAPECQGKVFDSNVTSTPKIFKTWQALGGNYSSIRSVGESKEKISFWDNIKLKMQVVQATSLVSGIGTITGAFFNTISPVGVVLVVLGCLILCLAALASHP